MAGMKYSWPSTALVILLLAACGPPMETSYVDGYKYDAQGNCYLDGEEVRIGPFEHEEVRVGTAEAFCLYNPEERLILFRGSGDTLTSTIRGAGYDDCHEFSIPFEHSYGPDGSEAPICEQGR